MIKKTYLFIIIAMLLPLASYAYDKEENAALKHEFRIGWGDMMYETAVFYNSYEKQDYRYTGHIFAGYHYHFNHWLSAGMQLDWEKVSWNQGSYFTNFSILPEVRFTYFKTPWVNMYSGLGLGVCINGGSETDYKGRKTICAPALGLTLFGISVGRNGWFGALDLGGLNAMNGKNEIFMFASRVFSISVGYRF